MVPTYSKHGPDMVIMSTHSVDIGLRPCLLSLENFSVLAGLEVRLGQTWSQHGPNMALTWSQKLKNPSCNLAVSKAEPNSVQTWP